MRFANIELMPGVRTTVASEDLRRPWVFSIFRFSDVFFYFQIFRGNQSIFRSQLSYPLHYWRKMPGLFIPYQVYIQYIAYDILNTYIPCQVFNIQYILNIYHVKYIFISVSTAWSHKRARYLKWTAGLNMKSLEYSLKKKKTSSRSWRMR